MSTDAPGFSCPHDILMVMSCHWCDRHTGSERRCVDPDCTHPKHHPLTNHHLEPPWPPEPAPVEPEREAELPQIKVVAAYKTQPILSTGPGEKDIRVTVVVMNPSDEVYDQLRRLIDTGALITLGGVPE